MQAVFLFVYSRCPLQVRPVHSVFGGTVSQLGNQGQWGPSEKVLIYRCVDWREGDKRGYFFHS